MRALILAVALVLASPTWAAIVGDWSNPGRDPFRGSRIFAVLYLDLPWPEKLEIVKLMILRTPTGRANITATGIEDGDEIQFTDDVNDMHFGRDRFHPRVSRAGWPPGHVEPATFYCAGQWCVGEPDVCKNIFWTRRYVAPKPIVDTKAAKKAGGNAAPEPGTLWLVLVAVVAVIVLSNRIPK